MEQSQEIIIRQPDPEPHIQAGSLAVQTAEEAVIENNDDKELAGEIVQQLRNTIKRIEFEFDGSDTEPGPVALQYKAWKAGVALREKAVGNYKKALDTWTVKGRQFDYAVEQKRLAEAQEEKRKADKKAKEERERQLAAAKKLGDKEAVNQLKQAPISPIVAPPKTPEVAKTAGFRRSTPIWDWEVTNLDQVPCKWHILNEKGITDTVKSLGPKHGIPGISVFDARSRGTE